MSGSGDYISREAAIDSLLGWAAQLTETYGENDEYVKCLESAAYNIQQIPAADVRPVVRGRDICDTVNAHCEFKCSVCGVEISSVYGGENDFGLDGGYFNFCPNCGAQMEEK